MGLAFGLEALRVEEVLWDAFQKGLRIQLLFFIDLTRLHFLDVAEVLDLFLSSVLECVQVGEELQRVPTCRHACGETFRQT